MIYLSSDLHLGHNKEFLYAPRGFANVQEMNEYIIEKQNNVVSDEDDYYILGDVTLGKLDDAIPYLKRLKGKIHVIRGNHDTDTRIECYRALGWEVVDAKYMKYGKVHLYMSHYPMMTGNYERRPGVNPMYYQVINLHGHTHQNMNFNYGPYAYHVGCDSHDCTPILLDNILKEIKANIDEVESAL